MPMLKLSAFNTAVGVMPLLSICCLLLGTELLADYSNGDDTFWDTIAANTQQYNYVAAERRQLEVRVCRALPASYVRCS
jgi:hypothetical protein